MRCALCRPQYLAKPGARPYCSAQPLGVQLPAYTLDPDAWSGSERLRLAPKLPEAFWRAHAPTPGCALATPDEPLRWTCEVGEAGEIASEVADEIDEIPWPVLEMSVRGVVVGEESLMAPKAHGSSACPVQSRLRWGCDGGLAERICSHNRHLAEPRGYYESTSLAQTLARTTRRDGVLTFFDSVSMHPLSQLSFIPSHPIPAHPIPSYPSQASSIPSPRHSILSHVVSGEWPPTLSARAMPSSHRQVCSRDARSRLALLPRCRGVQRRTALNRRQLCEHRPCGESNLQRHTAD
jgi:hypothetical protein